MQSHINGTIRMAIFKLMKKSYKYQSISKFILTFFILVISLLSKSSSIAFSTGSSYRNSVDYIFLNSNIITINNSNPLAEAIAINNGYIVGVGSTNSILEQFETNGDTTFDMEGRTIMPGIIDGHTHLMVSMLLEGSMSMSEAQEIQLSYGFTTLNEKLAYNYTDHILPFQLAELNGTLRTRLNLFPIHNLSYLDENNESIIVENYWDSYNPILDHDKLVRVPGIKIFVDGVWGMRGLPAMSMPYPQDLYDAWGGKDPYGDLYFNQTVLNATVKTIQDHGYICAFHSMGDRAIETVLNAIEYAVDGETNDIYRHQLEHNSFMRDDLITKAVSLHSIHSICGYYPTFLQEVYKDAYPDEWEGWNINRYSLPSLGVHSYLETDFRWVEYNPEDLTSLSNIKPFMHMWSLVTKKAIDENGTIHLPDPWLAEFLLTREQALKLMTIEGAYAVKQEDYLGTLDVGKFADLIILTNDPLTCQVDDIKDIEVMLTMIDGNIEYKIQNSNFPKIYSQTHSIGPINHYKKILISSVLILTIILLTRKKKK
ncbi:MAG: amidohydrolase family protein [Asgard group archaeon]|nr:amidohydrolase family protein [Asgard group archaeon]